MLGARGADASGPVGRRRGNRHTGSCKNGAGNRVTGNAHGDRVEAGGDQIGDRESRRFLEDQRQRPWPERLRQSFGHRREDGEFAGGIEIGHVGNQWVEARPALGLEDPRHRLRIGRIGAEPVNRLGRKRDEMPGRQETAGLGNGFECHGLDRHEGQSWFESVAAAMGQSGDAC